MQLIKKFSFKVKQTSSLLDTQSRRICSLE